MTTDLSGGTPEGSMVSSGLKTLQGTTEDDIRNNLYGEQRSVWGNAKQSLFGNFIGSIFNGFLSLLQGGSAPSWLPGPVQSAAAHISDGMTALAGRTDLLEGVRGFCMAYQTLNINTAWSLSANVRQMPFNGAYGPAKGAHIEGNGITLDEAGAWRIDSMVRAQSTSFAGGDGTLMDIIVYKPDGTEHVRRRFDSWTGTGVESIYGGFPLVIDSPGYYIRVETWTDRWRWWTGGTMYTFLSAVKYDNRAINPGQSTVPNETQ